MARTRRNLDQRIFDNSGRYLDKFELLFLMSVATVALNSLIDIDDPTENLASEIGWLIVTLATGLTFVLALRSSGMRRRLRTIAEVIVWLLIATVVIITIFDATGGVAADAISGARPSLLLVVIAFLSPVVVLRRIFVHTKVDRTTLLGAISVYMLLAIAFQYVFLYSAGRISGDFFNQGFEPTTSYMYFSLVTITTLGYGDLSPATEVGQFLATAEALIGQVFLVTVVARLVSLYGLSRPDTVDEQPAD
mgnify:CR=1 FL=1